MIQTNFSKSYDQDIIISQDIIVRVNDMLIFPHGYDGFHLWEAGIALTRYLHLWQKDNFKDKTILELGTGVGITGIYLAKFTHAKQVVMSDYNEQIIQNAQKNALKNLKTKLNWSVLNLDWKKYKEYDYQFDYIVGADLIYTGAPLQELYETVKKMLCINGIFFLLIPDQRQAAVEFLKIIESDKFFTIEYNKLDDQRIYQQALKNLKQSQLNYPGLQELKFFIYQFKKIK